MYRIYDKTKREIVYLSDYFFDEETLIHRCKASDGRTWKIYNHDFKNSYCLMKKLHENRNGAIYENDYYVFYQVVGCFAFAPIGCNFFEVSNLSQARKNAKVVGNIYDDSMKLENEKRGIKI